MILVSNLRGSGNKESVIDSVQKFKSLIQLVVVRLKNFHS